MILLWAQLAQAGEGPHLYLREYTAVAVAPRGLVTDLVAEARAPILRLGGVAFNDTFAGVGTRLALSPAHADLALRCSVQAIDLLPVSFELVYTRYWESPWGLVPMRAARRSTSAGRQRLYDRDEDFAGSSLTLVVNPTLQARVGPVAAFSSWNVARWLLDRPDDVDTPYVWEPYRGMTAGWHDTLVEHTSAVLWEPLSGEDGPLLRLGPALRGKHSAVTPDRTLALGGVVQLRPSTAPAMPTFLLVATAYLADPDFVGGPPFGALVATWEGEISLE